ncbi:stage III sporulation protein AE [Hathewaya histolytica]|uniref:Stage III sporulation protein AE n=1 Tax=Hathewaya histolytica TaxID=1498 RepID=A0A4U9R964_HATHI|nr:stage III sporulation protein AE [Hathewaya histolytica]VTQ88134.1 stage III sporulation protein AE [Hathewaya histolytica]
MINTIKKKRYVKIFFLIIFLIILPIKTYGNEAFMGDKDTNNLKRDEVLKKAYEEEMEEVNGVYNHITNMKSDYEILKDIEPKEFVKSILKDGKGDLNRDKIIKNLKRVIFKEVSSTFKLMGMLIIICIVCSMLKNLEDAFSNNSISSVAYFACLSTMIIIIAKSFYIGIDVVKSSIESISGFMYSIIPVLMTLLAGMGGVTQAAFLDPIIIFILNMGITIISNIIIPLIIMSFVLNFVNNISEEYKVSNLSSLIKNSVLWIQGIVMTVFVALLTIRSIMAKTMDEVTIKTAKFTVDTVIPVVGKSLSDAISTVAGYSLLIKNAIGTLGLIILVLIIITPIIKVFIMAMLYKLTGALIQPISDKKVVNCITSAGDSLILIMSSLICVSVMCFIMIAIVTATGSSIISV